LIESIERGISSSDVFFADITTDNPNVWFELGFAIASRKSLCLVSCRTERLGSYPFDVNHRKIIEYSNESTVDFDNLRQAIISRLNHLIKQEEKYGDLTKVILDPLTNGLSDHERVLLGLLAADYDGTQSTLDNWALKQLMEKAGHNNLACNAALRGLHAKKLIHIIEANRFAGESYRITIEGWNWITENLHTFELRAPKKIGTRQLAVIEDDIPF
jgi:hypothetical protein